MNPTGPSQLLCCSLHPLGHFIAVATKEEIIEYAIVDQPSRLNPLRKINLSTSFYITAIAQPSSGNCEPYVCTTPPSIIAYGNGGHLLAVATGKVIRVYNMTCLDYHSVEGTGNPSMIFAAVDTGGYHSSLTSIRFTSNDYLLLTSSTDGYLYSWNLETSVRVGDYCMRAHEAQLLFSGVPSTMTTFGRSLGKLAKGFDLSSFQSGVEAAVAFRPVEVHSTESHAKPCYLAIWRTTKGTGKSRQLSSPKSSGSHSFGSGISSRSSATFSMDPEFIRLEHMVTCGASSWASDGMTRQEICILGFDNGHVIISSLPLPTTPLEATPSSTTAISSKPAYAIKESHCRRLKLSSASITDVAFSSSGNYFFTACSDGSVFVFSLNANASSQSVVSSFNTSTSLPEYRNLDNGILMVTREAYQAICHRLENHDEILQSSQENYSNQLIQMQNQVKDLQLQAELKIKNENNKRDAMITQLKGDIAKLSESSRSSTSQRELSYKRMLSEMEVAYEKKVQDLRMELVTVRQAYEEHFVHLKHELAEKEAKSMQAVNDMQLENDRLESEMKSQYLTMNLYCQYIKERHGEVFQDFEEAQLKELSKHNKDLQLTREALQEQAQRLKNTTVHYQTQYQRLKHESQLKEDEIIKLKAELITMDKKLQHALADTDVLRKEVNSSMSSSEHWEEKAKSLTQEVSFLERARKALHAQLLELRQQIHPNEVKVSQISEQMAEMENEYTQIMQRNRDLNRDLEHVSSTNSALTKQIRDLRKQCAHKDSSLRRAAKLLDDYTVVVSKKSSASSTDKDEDSLLLERIGELLRQYISDEVDSSKVDKVVTDDEAVLVKSERERHVHYLHASIQGLQKNLKLSKSVANAEVRIHSFDCSQHLVIHYVTIVVSSD
jgi:WD40 repeat protein